ncbi:hypothetical protein B0J17DRAFT_646200 [Rhizoctonia solani]|nr:hypothetical protein B0J17DRAFT_646200 [Rhizoctonia solani]
MQSDTSLLSSPRYKDHDDEHPSTNRGVVVTHTVGRHTRKSLAWLLWLALGATELVITLFDSVVWFYPEDRGPLVAQIQRMQRVMVVFATFFFPRLADVHSRAVSGALACKLFARTSVSTYAAGWVFYIVGSSGLDILLYLFISDYTSLRWRGMALAWIYFVPLITMWVESPISERFSSSWACKFGIIMFAICTPALVALHLVASKHPEETPQKQTPLIHKFMNGFVRMDPIGLSIFTIGFGLVDYNTNVWWDAEIRGQPRRVVMLIIGFILVAPVFILWEMGIPKRGVLFAVAIAFCCRAATILPMRAVAYDADSEESSKTSNYYFNAASMGRAVLAPVFGCLFLLTHRYKAYMLLGGTMLIVSCALGLHSIRIRYPPDLISSIVSLFAIQILEGVGGVAIDLGTMVGSQASVPHSDLATVVGVVKAIPIFGSPFTISFCRIFTNIATKMYLRVLSAVLCLIFSLFVPNYRLGNSHNAVERSQDDDLLNATATIVHSSSANL